MQTKQKTESIFISESRGLNTPLIDFNFDTGVLIMGEESMPEDVGKFYDPIVEQLEEFLKNPTEKIVFEMKMIYFNTGSSKVLMDIFSLLPEDRSKVVWYYDDNDMFEVGEEYYDLLDGKIPFSYESLPTTKRKKTA